MIANAAIVGSNGRSSKDGAPQGQFPWHGHSVQEALTEESGSGKDESISERRLSLDTRVHGIKVWSV
jgi:hypothetical protein